MKTDRLLSIIIYLLNRDLVTGRELAERFGVTVRTIQRDIETISLAGIPVITIQGPSGGYGIMKSFTLDRQVVSLDDLFYILTALQGVESYLPGGSIAGTIEKIRSLLPQHAPAHYQTKREKLNIDYSAFGGSERQQETFRLLEKAIDQDSLVEFSYRSNRLEYTKRVVEPMTLAFKWRSWYLFGYCRLRQDYRLFRLGRIREVQLKSSSFRRREKSFDEFSVESAQWAGTRQLDMQLKFDAHIRPLVEEFYPQEATEEQPDGSLIVQTSMPEDPWVYGLILSYGKHVEVLTPQHLRSIIYNAARDIVSLYE